MDLLYQRYASPMDLIRSYIDRGRFGEFVSEFLELEYERRKAEADKDDDLKLWIMYCHSYADESFVDWKKNVLKIGADGRKRSTDEDLTSEGIEAIYNDLFT